MSFSHLDPGTPEETWARAFDEHQVASLAEDFDHLIVVAAHPDDESLGAGGLMARAAARGIRIDVLVVTDGDRSHPASPTHTPADLAALRRDEVRAAASHLTASHLTAAHASTAIAVHFLGHPDGGTDDVRDAVAADVRSFLARADARTLVVSPWRGDGHRDHRVVGEIVDEVCAERGIRSRAYPIWLWHWGTPDDVPWPQIEMLDLGDAAMAAKQRANAEHRTQVHPLSDAPGDEAMLHAGMRAHFARSFEVFVAPPRGAGSLPPSFFDAFYARNSDPWGFDSRWYEERKRGILLAALPRPRYAAALELGCSTGALTASLADRADRVLAVDFAASALRDAATRLAGRGNVELVRATLPAQWPEGRFDLIVLSEIGYYWDAADLDTAIGSMIASLAEGGHLVACHWRHPVADYPRSGDAVHEVLRQRPELARLGRHEEEDFVLEVYGSPSARSVAAETGLVP